MPEITSINNDKREGLQVFLEPVRRDPADLGEAAFFGIIWSKKEKLTKEILYLYKEAISASPFVKIMDQSEMIFDEVLQNLNALLLKYNKQKNLLNLLFGLKLKNKILFTHWGKIFSMLVDRKGKGEISVSILKDLLRDENETKLFSKFITGTLGSHQSIFFSTENINTYFTPLRLGTLLFTSSDALWQIKKSITKLDPNLSFGALYIFYKEKTVLTPFSSMQNLIATEAQTGRILAPPILPNLMPLAKKITQALFQGFCFLMQKTKGKAPDILQQLKMLTRKSKPLASQSLPHINARILIRGPQRMIVALRLSLNQRIEQLIHRFNNLPLLNKTLVLALLTLIFLFGQSLLYLNHAQGTRKVEKNFSARVAKIQDNIAVIKASLIYGDEESARILLDQIRNDFLQIEQNYALKPAIKNQLKEDFYSIEKTLKREVTLQTKNLFEFKDQKRPTTLLNFDDDIYLLSENSLLKLDLKQTILNIIYQNLSLTFGKAVVDDQRKLILLIGKNKIIEFNPQNQKTTEIKVSLNNLNDSSIYNRRLYILKDEPPNIFRLTKVKDGFSSAPWLKAEVDLYNGVSLAVDGNIYVLKQNGEVLKFTRGYKKDFSLSAIDPLLSSTAKIFTTQESDYLYILEKQNKRIAVFDKKGKLVVQYLADNIGELKDFLAKEQSKKIYLLSDKGVFEGEMTHLK